MRQQITSILVGIITLAVIAFGFYLFVAAIIDKLNSANSDLGKTIVGASLTLIGATVTLVVGKLWEQKIKIKQEIREKKIPIYEQQVSVLFAALFSMKTKGIQISEKELLTAFLSFTEKLVIWGDPEVIRAWQEFRNHTWNTDAIGGFRKLEAFILALRKDIGTSNGNLTGADLMKLFINDYDALRNTQ
jgi:hypothetical protein